jgi:hypothetical protein
MDYRVLSDVDAFRDEFVRSSGVAIPIEYFHASVVTGAIDGHGRLVGGWATAPGRVGRWLSQIPEVERRCSQIDVERSFELNAVWLAASLRGQGASAEFWRALAHDVAGRDVVHVIFAVNPRRRGLAALYEGMAAGVLYEGPISNSTVPAARYYHSSPQRFAEIEQHYAERLRARMAATRRGRPGTGAVTEVQEDRPTCGSNRRSDAGR